jgi:hypothetical protein
MKVINTSKSSILTSFLNFSIIVLFLTNLWIILCLAFADYAYFAFHTTIHDLGLGNPPTYPEPFKIPFYLISTFVFATLIWVVNVLIKKIHIPEKFITGSSLPIYFCRFFIFLFLLALFISKLGAFPLGHDAGYFSLNGFISAYSQPHNNLVLLVLILYLGFVGLIMLESALLQKFIKNQRYYRLGIYIIALINIIIVTFDARFVLPALDAAYFYGPVWEVAHGKTILNDIPTLYGFLSVFLFSAIYKITHLNYIYLPIIVWILWVIEYIICFDLILKISKSVSLAFLGLFSLITINYFGLFHNPQTGPLRWAPFFICLYLFFRLKKIDAKFLIFAVAILSLWNIDSGLALLMSYISTLALLFLLKQISLRKIINSGVYLFLSFLAIFTLVETINVLFQHKLINIFKLYLPLRENSLGFNMRPLETHTYFWFLLLVYFSAIIYFFRNIRSSTNSNLNNLLLFSANMMFFVGNYYVGRSLPHNVISISPFIIFAFFLLVALSYHNLKTNKGRLIVLCGIFLLLIIYPAFEKKEYLTNELLHKVQKLKEGHIFSSDLDQIVNEKYHNEAAFIKKNLPDDPIIILSADDTYLFYLTGKRNMLNINPSMYINLKAHIDISTQNLHLPCPKKIVYDCQIVHMCSPYNTLTRGFPEVFPIMLNSIEKKCQQHYKPSTCTDKLCVGEAQT